MSANSHKRTKKAYYAYLYPDKGVRVINCTIEVEMARYARFKNGEDRWVWDRAKDILYQEISHSKDEYQLANINMDQLGRFIPDTKDAGEFDKFPGEFFTDKELKDRAGA